MPRPPRQTVAMLAALVAALSAVLAPAAANAKRVVEQVQPPAAPGGEAPTAGEAPKEGSGGEDPAPEPPRARSERAERRAGRLCTLSLQAAPSSPVASGEGVELAGALTCPEPAEAEGREITIVQRERGTGRHELTATTGADGRFSLAPVLSADSAFVARFAGARSSRVLVKVAATVTLTGPADAGAALLTRGGVRRTGRVNRFTFTGTVDPAAAAALVTLQRRYSPNEPWREAGFARTDDEGRFSFTRAFRRSGEISLRAVAHLHGHVRSYSPVLTYVLSQAQNPALTIAAASDPLPAGQSTAISGLLAAGAGQTVVLLARTRGAGWAPAASMQSGEGGAYSFTVAPAVDTAYRVRSGRVSSTTLLLDVMPQLTLASPPSAAQAGVPVSFAGSLAGAPAGTPVRLQRELPGGRFLTVASSSAGADGTFAISVVFLLPGTETLRVATPPGAGTTGAVSEPFALLVSPGEGEA